jgi:hypothetical protein
MTRKQKDMLVSMLKGFNARLKEFDLPTYTYETEHYGYNSYAIEISYKVFHPTDLKQLYKFKEEHHLLLFLGSCGGTKAYIYIN